MKKGIYIHIPFCKSRCVYCGFYSTTRAELSKRYTQALLREMDLRSKPEASLGAHNTDTIYLGGGTPSVLHISDMELILRHVRQVYPGDVREITVEMNPDALRPNTSRPLGRLASTVLAWACRASTTSAFISFAAAIRHARLWRLAKPFARRESIISAST